MSCLKEFPTNNELIQNFAAESTLSRFSKESPQFVWVPQVCLGTQNESRDHGSQHWIETMDAPISEFLDLGFDWIDRHDGVCLHILNISICWRQFAVKDDVKGILSWYFVILSDLDILYHRMIVCTYRIDSHSMSWYRIGIWKRHEKAMFTRVPSRSRRWSLPHILKFRWTSRVGHL